MGLPIFGNSENKMPKFTDKKIRTCLHKKCVRIFEHNFVAE